MDKESVSKVLADRVSQELLNSTIPARLAYIGLDGLPRAIPIGFWWDGERIGLATAANAPKVEALRANQNVALTIDTETFPPHILLVRGTASVEIVDGVVQEWLEKARAP
jgi:Pyridoxamine 5'-phosphate oxidase